MPCSQFGSRAGVITAVYGNGSEGRAPRRGWGGGGGVGEEGEENDDEWSEPVLIAVAASS